MGNLASAAIWAISGMDALRIKCNKAGREVGTKGGVGEKQNADNKLVWTAPANKRGFFWGGGGLLINKVRKTSSVYLKYMNISRFMPLGGAKMLQNHWKRCHWLLTQSKAQSPTAHDLSEPREKWLWHRLMTHVGYTSECIKTDTHDKSCIKESHPLGEYAECQSHMGNLSVGFFLAEAFWWCEGHHAVKNSIQSCK